MKKLIKMMRFQQAQTVTAVLDMMAVKVTAVMDRIESDSCTGQDSSESEAGSDILQGCYLDPYDPEAERCYSYPHPKHDPLLAGFYRFQENKNNGRCFTFYETLWGINGLDEKVR